MRHSKTLGVYFVVFMIFLSAVAVSFAQGYKKGDDARVKMKKIAEGVTKRIKELSGPAETRREELEKARDELDKARDELYEAMDERREYLYKVIDDRREELYKAVEEMRKDVTEEKGKEIENKIKEKEKKLDEASKNLDQEMKVYEQAINEFVKAMDEFVKAMNGLKKVKEEEIEQSKKELRKAMNGIKKVKEEEIEQSKKELRELTKNLEYKKGSAIVALRDAELKVETKIVGSVRKGEKLTVEDVQGNWLSVRSGQTQGWIDRRNVVFAALIDWYKRLPDIKSVEDAGRVRAKFEGVLFDIGNPGAGPAIAGGSNMIVHGVTWPIGTFAGYENVNIFLQKNEGTQMILSLKFPGNYPMRANDPSLAHAYGRPYGTVMPGDYVFIDTRSRQVFVNGELRKGK